MASMTERPPMTEPGIEAAALKRAREAFKACRPVERTACQDFGMQQDDILDQQLEAAIAAINATIQSDKELASDYADEIIDQAPKLIGRGAIHTYIRDTILRAVKVRRPAASGDLRERIATLIAEHLEVSDETIERSGGVVCVLGIDKAAGAIASLPGLDAEAIRKDERELYYLESILRQLTEYRDFVGSCEMLTPSKPKPRYLSDNIDWLDCRIASLKTGSAKP